MIRKIRVVTLNCWGMLFISKHREKRISRLGDELEKGRYDVVTLQEIMLEKDYKQICRKVKCVLPYQHYFHSGVLGSGMCIFSKWPIVDTILYRYCVNSYAYHIFEGDWYGGKSVGLSVLDVDGMIINVYVTHMTALYCDVKDLSSDKLFTHRLIQSFEMSEFVRLTGRNSDANVVCGDFNCEDYSLPYKVLKLNTRLKDSWVESLNIKEGLDKTVETVDNCYTDCKNGYYWKTGGMRIDYIMFNSNATCQVTAAECRLVFQKIPDSEIDYSDHKGVEVLLDIERKDVRSSECDTTPREDLIPVLQEALSFLQTAKEKTNRQIISYKIMFVPILAVLMSLWMSGAFQWFTSWYARLGVFAVLVILMLLGGVCFCIGSFVKVSEVNQIKGRIKEITLRLKRLDF